MIDALTKHDVSIEIIHVTTKLYKKSKAYLKLDKKEIFQIQRGIKQGNLLPRNIFNVILEEVFWKLDWDGLALKKGGRY